MVQSRSLRTWSMLDALLQGMEGLPYGAYRRLSGAWALDEGAVLDWVRIQADPFAPPSRMVFRVGSHGHPFAAVLREEPDCRIALADCVLRRQVELGLAGRLLEPSGGVDLHRPGPEIVSRSALELEEDGTLVCRFTLRLPGRGRRVDARAARVLLGQLQVWLEGLRRPLDPGVWLQHGGVYRDYLWIQRTLQQRGGVAFVANGAVLPRRSGDDTAPLPPPKGIPFLCPPRLEVCLDLPHAGPTRGLWLPRGLTVITGGAYHGKTTFLNALEQGIYPHVPGDGRERVVCDAGAVKIRARDGRPIHTLDLSPFFQNLPFGLEASRFSSNNASGSTSQAASLLESLLGGARVLLLDEDSSAANLLYRDEGMRRLTPARREPIIPLSERVQGLVSSGVSVILAMGGNSAFLRQADRVLGLEEGRVLDETDRARSVCSRDAGCEEALQRPWPPLPVRGLTPVGLRELGGPRGYRVLTRGTSGLKVGPCSVDLGDWDQLVHPDQVATLGWFMALLAEQAPAADRSWEEQILSCVEGHLPRGWSSLPPGLGGRGRAEPPAEPVRQTGWSAGAQAPLRRRRNNQGGKI